MTTPRISDTLVETVRLTTYTFPTTLNGAPHPEADGTAEWDATTVLLVEVDAGKHTGIGYTYTSGAAFEVARSTLTPLVLGTDPLAVSSTWTAMARAVRNMGYPGIAAAAVSAIDVALHDLAARLLDVSLLRFLGAARERVMAYGSGGFTNYTDGELTNQLGGWGEDGYTAVKMKVGADPERDAHRTDVARAAIGQDVALFVDANGAYDRKQALHLADQFAARGARWFEEPVSSDDLTGLRLLRDRAPAVMQIAAGEYGYTQQYFHTMLGADAVDTIQADATRCGGVTGFRSAAVQAQAASVPLSAHTSPALHATLGAALPGVVHVEAFHDHLLIEQRLFDGVPQVRDGSLAPDPSAPGLGLTLRTADAVHYRTLDWSS